MKNKNRLHLHTIILVSVLLTFATGCKKDNTTTNTNTPTASSGNYQPTTKGSTWNYNGSKQYTVTSLGSDTLMNGKTYYLFDNSVSGQAYFIKENNTYYWYSDMIGLMPILKDNLAVGGTWKYETTISFTACRYVFTIKEVNISKTVNTTAYKNVIHVQQDSYFDYYSSGSYTLASTDHYYYAKDIGLIFVQGTSISNLYLESYVIK